MHRLYYLLILTLAFVLLGCKETERLDQGTIELPPELPPKTETPPEEPPPTIVTPGNCPTIDNTKLARTLWMRGVGEYRPENETEIAQIAQLLNENKKEEAAEIIVSQPGFIDRTIFEFADRIQNIDGSAPGNMTSFIAFFQGVTMDERPITDIFANGLYVVRSTADPTPPPVEIGREDHWRYLVQRNVRASDSLVYRQGPQWTQADVNENRREDVPAGYNDFAGVLTLSTNAREMFNAGTNRRAINYVFKSLLCRSLEEAHDPSMGDLWVARDVDRFPPAVYQSKCVGCHGGLDALRGAFAMTSARGDRITFHNEVVEKYAANSDTFEDGRATTSAQWVNFFRFGRNQEEFGWRGPANSGTGVASFAQLVANSEAFTNCMVENAYRKIWLKNSNDEELQKKLKRIARDVEQNTNTFREIFIKVIALPQCI